MHKDYVAIPPEVFPTLSMVVKTRADWATIRQEELVHWPPVMFVPTRPRRAIHIENATNIQHFNDQYLPDADQELTGSSNSDEISISSVDVALQRRQEDLIGAAFAISTSIHSVTVTPGGIPPKSSIWSVQGSRELFGFNLLVLSAAIIVSVLAYRNLNATLEVVSLMDKVNHVGSIENRIAEKLDQSNLGIQNLINETNSRISFLQTQVSALPADTKGIVKELGDIANDMLKIPAQLTTAQQLQPLPQMVTDAPSVPKSPRPKRLSVRNSTIAAADIMPIQAPKPLPAASKAFRRIVAEDGSIKFEKIR